MGALVRELRQVLHDAGCVMVRQGKGDHEIWFSPINGKNFVVDAGLDYRHLANVVLKQAGLPKSF
jgi:HicA toxin of bacterial toxin-antitoxin,